MGSNGLRLCRALLNMTTPTIAAGMGLIVSGCIEQNAAVVEELGISLAPYIDIADSDSIDPLITANEANALTLSGACGSPSSLIEVSIPKYSSIPAWTLLCSSEKTWTTTLNLTAVPDGVFSFSIRHYRQGTERFGQFDTNPFKKITQPPSAPTTSQAPAAVNNSSINTGRIIISWPTSYDSAGEPLVEYQIAIGVGTPTNYTPEGWVSVGGLTQAQIDVPPQLPEGSDVYVSILGFDQTGTAAANPTVSDPIRIDQTAPTIVGPVTASIASSTSTSQSPEMSWSTAGWNSSDIATLEYRVEDTSTQQEIRGWSLNSQIQSAHTVTGLVLQAGKTYRYELRAKDSAGNVSNIISTTWSVVAPGSTPQLVFATPPSSNAVLGVNLSIQPRIEARDPSGNLVSSVNESVSLSAHSDLNCTNASTLSLSISTSNLSSGAVTLSGLAISGAPGTVYIKATAAGTLSTCSSAVHMTGLLAFIATPSNTVINTDFPQFSVALQNGSGQGIGGASATVSLVPYPSGDSSCSGNSAPGALVNSSVVANNGTATFAQVQYDRAEGIRLKASAVGYSSVCSHVITVGNGTNPVPSITTSPLAWFKADAITGVSTGGTVSSWADSSGNNRSAGNGTAPSYQASVIGGKPVARFSGTQFLTVSNLNRPTQSYTIASVFSASSLATSSYPYGSGNSGGSSTTSWGSLNLLTNGTMMGIFGNDSNYSWTSTASGSVAVGTPIIVIQRYTGGATQEIIRKNGVQLSTTASATGANACTGTNYPFALGRVGAVSGNYYFNGDLAEVIIYHNALSDSDLRLLEGYLSKKYSISIPMTVSHAATSPMLSNETLQMNVSGGTTPYQFSVTGGGSISGSGLYTAPASGSGTATITITDSSNPAQSQTASVIYREPGTCGSILLSETFSDTATLAEAPYFTRWNTYLNNASITRNSSTQKADFAAVSSSHWGASLISKSTFYKGAEISMRMKQNGIQSGCAGDCGTRGIYLYGPTITPTRDPYYGSPSKSEASWGFTQTAPSNDYGIVEVKNTGSGTVTLVTSGVFGSYSGSVANWNLANSLVVSVRVNTDNTFVIKLDGVSVRSGNLIAGALLDDFKFETFVSNFTTSVNYNLDDIQVTDHSVAGCP